MKLENATDAQPSVGEARAQAMQRFVVKGRRTPTKNSSHDLLANEAVSFSVFGTLPGLNEIIDANRRHRYQGAALKRNADTIVLQYIRVARVQPFFGPVFLTFAWHEPDRRRDCDNVAAGKKFILDALVTAGILAGDGRQNVVGFSDEFHVDEANPRVVVTIERTSA